MDLLDYTTYPEIRSLLGVNDVELPDETLSLDVYSSELDLEFDDVSLSLRPRYATVVAIEEASRTIDQDRFIKTVRVFAAYTVAKSLAGSLPMFGPKTVTDSKTEVSRFANDPFKETIKTIKSKWELYKNRTIAALAVVDSSTSTRTALTVMLVSSPSSDPVTG